MSTSYPAAGSYPARLGLSCPGDSKGSPGLSPFILDLHRKSPTFVGKRGA